MNPTPCLFFALIFTQASTFANTWVTDTQEEWVNNQSQNTHLEIKEGLATPTEKGATYQSKIQTFDEAQKPVSIEIAQSPSWQNWNPVSNIGPSNLGDAPVFLRVGDGDYWMFGRYRGTGRGKKGAKPVPFTPEAATLEGFDIPLQTTSLSNVFDAPGGLEKSQGGYHAWQSKDMKNWVHHGPITNKKSRWMTSAEYADGKAYFYYDFPNDQDPHVYIDGDLFDGKPGEDIGMAYKDSSHGSDSGIIRDLEGNFHLIVENWDPIKASDRAWDSPLANHAMSQDGKDFKFVGHAVDHRTEPTGKMATYKHPHWKVEDPENYPTNVAEYEIHEPAQEAYGDWAAIAIGGQYYLFGDHDPPGAHGKSSMDVGWFTSSDINEPFTWCGSIGKGHPDPDVIFAEGQFYLATQQKRDFVSPGPWVESVEVRVGVDSTKDGKINEWTDWQQVKETYSSIKGFAKQVAKTPASLDLSTLPEGYGFQYEIKITDTTENPSKPVLDKVTLTLSE